MKFSIRDVLWLTVVVALGVCWALDRVTLMRAVQQAKVAERHQRLAVERAMASEAVARVDAEMARAAGAKLQSTTAP